MTGMTLELKTEHIQLLVLSIILRDKKHESAEDAEMYKDLEDVLTEMNTLCTEDNNYTLTVEVSA